MSARYSGVCLDGPWRWQKLLATVPRIAVPVVTEAQAAKRAAFEHPLDYVLGYYRWYPPGGWWEWDAPA